MHKLSAMLLVVVLSGCQAPGLKVSDEVSASGLDYSLIRMPGNSRVSVQIAWPSDWAFDQAQNQAVPYIGTQLILAGGAEGYPAGEVVERFPDMKSEGRLAAKTEYVLGTLHYSSEHQAETLKMANAHLGKPTLDERWFKRISHQFSEQIREVRANPANKGFEAMRWAVFGEQPIRAALSQDEPNMIDDVTRSDIQVWTKALINRSGASIVIAGDLDAKAADVVIDSLFEGLPQGLPLREAPIDADFSKKRILLHLPEAKTSTLSFIGKLPPSREGMGPEDSLLNMALGVGEHSVLFDAVRTALRASYHYGSSIQEFTRKHRVLILTGQIETSKVAEAEKIIREAYAKFRVEGPSGDLEQRKKPIKEHLKKIQKDTGGMAYLALMAKLDEVDAAKVLGLQKELDAVSENSLKQRLNTAFPEADELMVVVSSPDVNALKGACVITAAAQAVECK